MDGTLVDNREKLYNFLGRFFKVDSVRDEDDFYEKVLVNSLFSMQMVMFIESEFDITVQPEDLAADNFNSVKNILKFIERKKGEANV
jgi:Acyl carrier protein